MATLSPWMWGRGSMDYSVAFYKQRHEGQRGFKCQEVGCQVAMGFGVSAEEGSIAKSTTLSDGNTLIQELKL